MPIPPTMRLLFATCLVFSAGCLSLGTLHTAKPVKEGDVEIMAAVEGYGIAAEGGATVPFIGPVFEGGFRYGVNDSFDFGLRVSTGLSFTVDFNIALINTDVFVLSLDPTFSGAGIVTSEGSVFLGYVFLPVLMDVVNLEGFVLTLGVKPGIAIVGGEVSGDNSGFASATSFVMGGSAAFRFKLTKAFHLGPELDLLAPICDGCGGAMLYSVTLGIHYQF